MPGGVNMLLADVHRGLAILNIKVRLFLATIICAMPVFDVYHAVLSTLFVISRYTPMLKLAS